MTEMETIEVNEPSGYTVFSGVHNELKRCD